MCLTTLTESDAHSSATKRRIEDAHSRAGDRAHRCRDGRVALSDSSDDMGPFAVPTLATHLRRSWPDYLSFDSCCVTRAGGTLEDERRGCVVLKVNESPTPPHVPPTGPAEVRALPAPPTERKRWPWIIVSAVIITIGLAGTIWWLLDSTVPNSEYDEVVAELAASEEALVVAEADAAMLGEEAAGLRSEGDDLASELAVKIEQVAELEALSNSVHYQLADAMAAAKANAYLRLDWLPEDVAAMEDAGIDLGVPNALLQELGEDEVWTEWAGSTDAWVMRDRYMLEIGDDALMEAWARYWDAEIGSAEEMAALTEFDIRLAYLILEPLVED